MKRCRHDPYAMEYGADEARCRDCGQRWEHDGIGRWVLVGPGGWVKP